RAEARKAPKGFERGVPRGAAGRVGMARLAPALGAPPFLPCGSAAGPPGAPPPVLSGAGPSRARFRKIELRVHDRRRRPAGVYRPRPFDAGSGSIWLVLHGQSRDVERYVRAAAPVAERYGALVLAPHVSKEAYPRGEDYTLNESLYAEIDRLFDAVRGALHGR